MSCLTSSAVFLTFYAFSSDQCHSFTILGLCPSLGLNVIQKWLLTRFYNYFRHWIKEKHQKKELTDIQHRLSALHRKIEILMSFIYLIFAFLFSSWHLCWREIKFCRGICREIRRWQELSGLSASRSVTRWLDYMFNIWSITTNNICSIVIIICQIFSKCCQILFKPSINGQRFFKFRHSGLTKIFKRFL